MPVSLGEWRVRIGTFVCRRRKEYDYNYFWRKLQNLIKQTKNAEPTKENDNPECNISSPSGSSPDVNRSPSNTARQSAFSYNVNLNTIQTGPLCDVINGRGNTNSPTLSQIDVPECDTVKENGSPCDVNNTGHNHVSHSESSCGENIGSSIEKATNPVPDATKVNIAVPQPCVEDELDNRDIAINLMLNEYIPKSTQICKTGKPEVGTSDSYSHVPAGVPGETDCTNRDMEETSDCRPSWIEDQSSDLSPKHRLNTMINTDQRASSIRVVTENHGSLTYPVIQSGTTSGQADAIKENDCSDMTNILLLRSGDVERNPGPNDNPGSLTERELYLLAEGMDPPSFRKVGLALGFTEARLSFFGKDKQDNPMQATYQMLNEWRKTVQEREARDILVNKLESVALVHLAGGVRKGQVGDDIPSMTEEEIKQIAEEVKGYYEIHLCQIQTNPLNSELLIGLDKIFSNLTLMEDDKGTKHKTPLLYDDLLKTKVNGKYPKRLLVEGEVGVGKTTLCAKIAWDWIHGKGYQYFKLVLVVLLHKAEGKTVGQIVKTYLSDNNPVTAKQLDKHILSNPDEVFLVLDGLDESTIDLNSNQQIALITSNRLFNSGTVLITSRQWRSDEIRKNANLRKVFAFIAVEGFSAENLSSYITKFFHPDTASSEDLSRFISNNDVIRENMVPYPIYTAMLCIMWKEFDGERREAISKLQTFSQLFNQIFEFLVDHYVSKHIPSSGIVEGKMWENRSDIRHHLIQIGHIAFKGLLERRLVFTEEDFHRSPESIDVGCKVGVLTREKKVLPRHDRRTNPKSAVQLVLFPHKLFQEYLSGIYLASLYNSNCNEYYKLIANIIKEAGEYRHLLYLTLAQQKTVGFDIVSRLIASTRQLTYCRIDDNFIVDVAYETQDHAVAKVVADHLSSESNMTLKIPWKMKAHTVSGHIFIMNHREVHHLIIETSCGRTASEDLAEFMLSSRSLRSVEINSTMHDVFYSVLANNAIDSKIETLNIKYMGLTKRPSASRDLAQFICKMRHLKALTLDGQYHDDFYSILSSMASSAKIETLHILAGDLRERPSASSDNAQFICRLPHLKDLTLYCQYHDDFYSTSSSMASSAKIETLELTGWDLRERPYASRDLAQFICNMPHLKDLTLDGQYQNDFYSTSSSMASSAKIETLNIRLEDLSEHPYASRDLAQFICKMQNLKNLTIPGRYHDDFYSTSLSIASSAKSPYFTRRKHEEKLQGFPIKTEEVLTRTTNTSPGKTVSSSHRPSASTSFGISTSEARVLSIDEEHEDNDKYHSEGIFDHTGGKLHIPSYGFTLTIPPGALPEGSSETISLDVLTDIPPEITLGHDEMLVTYGFQCLPPGLQFESEKPVRLRMPHCANLIDPTKVQVVLYSLNHEGGIDRIIQTSRTCHVTYSNVEISLEHFSRGFSALRNRKPKQMSLMPFLPKMMPEDRKVALQFRMVNKPDGTHWRNAHAIDQNAEFQPAKGDDDVMTVKPKNMEVTCQLSDSSRIIKKVNASFIKEVKHTLYFVLDFRGRADDLFVKLNVIQSSRRMEILFKTHFRTSPGITDTSLGDTVSTPPTPSASTSAAISLQDASAVASAASTASAAPAAPAAREVSTSRSSDTVSEGELNTLADNVPHEDYIDLANKLGIRYNKASTILSAHSNNSHKAMRECLSIWKNRTGGSFTDLQGIFDKVDLGGVWMLCFE